MASKLKRFIKVAVDIIFSSDLLLLGGITIGTIGVDLKFGHATALIALGAVLLVLGVVSAE